jgi:hypothetical protein
MRGVTILPGPEVLPMLFADCPLCDGAAPFDPETGALDCAACGVRLDLADEPALPELAAA